MQIHIDIWSNDYRVWWDDEQWHRRTHANVANVISTAIVFVIVSSTVAVAVAIPSFVSIPIAVSVVLIA